MAVVIVLVCLCLAVGLIYAGAEKLERRAEKWERYERFMHPPDDEDDGVTLLKDQKEEQHENRW